MTAESEYMSGRSSNRDRTEAVTTQLQKPGNDLAMLISVSEQEVVDVDGQLFEETSLERETFIHNDVETVPLEPAGDDALQPRAAVKQATEAERIHTEWSLTWERQRTLRFVITPVSQSTEMVLATGVDITDLVNRVETLERKNNRLDEFASVVSHDIRNPLNVAMLNLTLLADEYDRSEIDTARKSLDRIDSLINDLLVVAREGRKVNKTNRIDLSTLATAAWGHVETNGATLEVESSCQLTCDRTRLSQVFENLFRNSVEHGIQSETATGRTNGQRSGGHADQTESITVRVGCFENGFYIEDDGQGIPADERDEIFDLGYSDSETGTGFGLAIVESIIDAHGWQITATESESGGARFEIET